MTRVIIQPAGSREPREHFEATIKNPVSLDRFRRFLTPEQISSLEAAYGATRVPVWGLTPSGRAAERDEWNQMGADQSR